MQHKSIIAISMLFAVMLSACAGTDQATSGEEKAVTDYASLLVYFETHGAKVSESGQVTQPFTSVNGKTISVNGGSVQVFEYSDNDRAMDEIILIQEFLQAAMIMWLDTPHFYQVNQLVLIYIGNDAEIIRLLEAIAGPEFVTENK